MWLILKKETHLVSCKSVVFFNLLRYYMTTNETNLHILRLSRHLSKYICCCKLVVYIYNFLEPVLPKQSSVSLLRLQQIDYFNDRSICLLFSNFQSINHFISWYQTQFQVLFMASISFSISHSINLYSVISSFYCYQNRPFLHMTKLQISRNCTGHDVEDKNTRTCMPFT